MIQKYYPPEFGKGSFNCPYCQVYAKQNWYNVSYKSYTTNFLEDLKISICSHCNSISYWFKEKLIIPDESMAPQPHEDLPEEIKEDYLEARSILNRSPRGAAALLRLCVQKLMIELGETGRNINNDIASLVKKGLPQEVQQALDILRVIGNEAVHPGTLDLKDDNETALRLFELINFIVEDRITRKKRIQELYSKLPESKVEQIKKRDKSN